jgi:hypothetical protein
MRKQWVNLTPDAKWLAHFKGDDAPTSVEELGPFHVKVSFKNPEAAAFKTQVELVSGVAYTPGELGRNANFRGRRRRFSATNEGAAEVLLDHALYLPAAGGSEYVVRSKHESREDVKVVETQSVTARRALFYYAVVQDCSDAPNGTARGGNEPGAITDTEAVLNALEGLYWDKGFFIRLVRTGTASASFGRRIGDDFRPKADNPAEDEIDPSMYLWRTLTKQSADGVSYAPLAAGAAKGKGIAVAGRKWEGTCDHITKWEMFDAIKGAIPRALARELQPLFFVIAACNSIAFKAKRTVSFTAASIAGGSMQCHNDGDDVFLKVGTFLWHGFSEAEDAAKSWFVSCECVFTRPTGVKTPVTIPRDKVTLVTEIVVGDFGGHKWVKLDLSGPELIGVARGIAHGVRGTFELSLTCHVVRGFAAGLQTGNLVLLADKANYRKRTTARKIATAMHEVGHLLGMASEGGKPPEQTATRRGPLSPDANDYLYGNVRTGSRANNYGHQGNHCANGASYDTEERKWSGTPECVMFGCEALEEPEEPPKFCSACEPIVIKLDCGGRLFLGSVTD